VIVEASLWIIFLLGLVLTLTFLSLVRDIREDLKYDKEIEKESMDILKEERK